jgi:ATP/maltotriose-dependent transcriptional regulator MalT
MLDHDGGGHRTAIDQEVVWAQVTALYGQEAFLNNQNEQAIAWCREALAKLPRSWSYLRGAVTLFLGLSLQAIGQLDSNDSI